MNREGVIDFLNAGTAFGQFSAQGFDALAFLDAKATKIGEQRGSWSKGCKHDRSHDAVGQVDAARVSAPPSLLNDKVVELLVSLHTAVRGRHHGDPAPALTQEPMSAPKIASIRGIRLHVIGATTPWKIVHQAPCHIDVG